MSDTTTPTLRRCACVSEDPVACFAVRHEGYYVSGCGVRDPYSGETEECWCACHADYDDGRYDHWDADDREVTT